MSDRESAQADGKSETSGVLMAALVILQLIIIPMQGWVGLTLWDLRDRISETQETSAVLQSQSISDHSRYDRRLEDHEQRLRSLERQRTSMLTIYEDWLWDSALLPLIAGDPGYLQRLRVR